MIKISDILEKIIRPKKKEQIIEKGAQIIEREEQIIEKEEQIIKKKTILFVDDEQFVLDGLNRLLWEYRKIWKLAFALSGEEALEIIRREKPDLVVADVMMPGMSGFELLERIKKENLSTPVIMLTGYQERTLKRQALDLGAFDFLNKPINKEDLVSRINATFRIHTAEVEFRRLENLVDTQEGIIKSSERKIEYLSKRRYNKDEIQAGRYRAICGAAVHSLKGEFLHIGFAIEQIRESGSMSPDILGECDMIERSMTFSRILLQRLIDYLDIGRLRLEPIDTRELVKKTELLARPRLLSNINMKITIAPDIKKPMVSGNFEQLMGVLLELINNASNALRKKRGTIELSLEERDGEITISITDDGEGIPTKIRDRLFTEQVPSQSGLGLGLFLSYNVVRELGGNLILKNSSSKGTTFLVLLPTINDKKED